MNLLRVYLKSNMDRFIEYHNAIRNIDITDLKSNMDRFIVGVSSAEEVSALNLKSNMDRFIAASLLSPIPTAM